MKNSTYFLVACLACVSVFTTRAQQDYTSYIIDAAIESNPANEAWSNTRVLSGEKFAEAPDPYYLDMWNSSAYDYEASQTVTGLPNGLYSLTAAVRSSDNTFELFATTAAGDFTATIPNTGNSGNVLGGGWQYLTVENIEVTDGTMTLGIRGHGAAGVWVSADVFQLLYYGKEALITSLNEKITEVQTNLLPQKMQDAVVTLLNSAISTGQSALATDTYDALLAANLAMDAAITAANTSIANYAALKAVIDQATTEKVAGGEGLAALETAIATATAIWTAATTDDAATTAATTAMTKALWTYRFDLATPENPLDMTGLIVNPNFDINNSGWSRTTGSQNYGIFTAETKTEFTNLTQFPNGIGDMVGGVWENWSSSAYTGKMYQLITGLPNGKYTLSATVFSNLSWEEVKTVNIYDTDGETVIGTDVAPYQDWLFLYANEGRAPVTQPRHCMTWTTDGLVNDSTLEIGIVITDLVGNWFGVDNFKLFYNGYDLVAAANTLQAKIDHATEISADVMSDTYKNELQGSITQGNTAVGSSSKTALEAAIIRITAAITAAESSIAAYTTLNTAIADANTNKGDYTTFPGYGAYETAIATAESAYSTHSLDNEGVAAAVKALQEAAVVCRLTQPAPFDATFAILNPSFEGGSYQTQTYPDGSTYYTAESWTLDYVGQWGATSSEQKKMDAGSEARILMTTDPFDGTKFYNIWSPNIESIDLYQDLWLPAGEYLLTAVIRSEWSLDDGAIYLLDQYTAEGTQQIYAAIGLNDYPSGPYAFNQDVFTTDWQTYEAWVRLEVEFPVEEDGYVRIGARSSNDGSNQAGWFQIDDFHLACNEKAAGINSPSVAGKTLYAHGTKGAVQLLSRGASDVRIYSVTGQLVKAVSVDGLTTVALAPGVYLIDKQKVIVK